MRNILFLKFFPKLSMLYMTKKDWENVPDKRKENTVIWTAPHWIYENLWIHNNTPQRIRYAGFLCSSVVLFLSEQFSILCFTYWNSTLKIQLRWYFLWEVFPKTSVQFIVSPYFNRAHCTCLFKCTYQTVLELLV